MPDLILRDTDPKELRADIISDVVEVVRELLHEASQPQLVGGDRLAELLETSRPTIDRLVKSGAIPSVSIGRLRRFEVRAVIDALRESAKKADAANVDQMGSSSEEGGCHDIE